MRFTPTLLSGVFEIDVERHADVRGSFERIYCAEEFAEHGLELPGSQSAISRNTKRATLRGLHVIPEAEGEAKLVRCIRGHVIPEAEGEAKLVRCIRGRVFDVAVDVRPGSATHGRHVSTELSAERGNALFLPRGVAHGFITLEDDSDLLYQFSQPYRPGVETGVRWDDPALAIEWPLAPQVISERDLSLPLLADSVFA